MCRLSLLLAAGAAALIPAVAYAQDDPEPTVSASGPEAEFAATRQGHIVALTGAEADSSANVPRARYALTTSTDDNVLAATIALKPAAFNGSSEHAFSITFKAPLGVSDGDTGSTVANLGLSDKFSGTVSYSLISTNFGATNDEAKANKVLHRRCRSLSADVLADEKIGKFCRPGGGIRSLDEGRLRQIAGNDAEAGWAVDVILGYDARKHSQALWLLNVNGSVGVRDYASRNPLDFSDRKTERASMAFSLTGGVSFGNTGLFLGGGYQYRRDYSDPEKRQVCRPGSTTDCPTEIFDLPKPDIDHTAFALVRFGGPTAIEGFSPIIEVKVAYDFQDKLWGVQVPIYFVSDEKGGLRGGLRFSYESRGNDPNKRTTTFGVFMVKSFDQLGLGF